MEESKQAPVEQQGEGTQIPYDADNVLRPERLEFETQDMYRARRAVMNKRVKNQLKGSMFFVASAVVPSEEKLPDGVQKRQTATFRRKDYPELFEEKVTNEKTENKNN